MCCQDSKPIFKGVVISSTIMMSLFCTFAEATSLNVDTVKPAEDNLGSSSSSPYCVYLEQSQELDCVCEDENDDEVRNHRDSHPVTFPGEDLLASGNRSVASVKLHSCRDLHLHLDLRSLARPFYRLRLEDLESVAVDGISLLPNDTVDVWMRNVNGTAALRGGVQCHGCGEDDANLNLHLLNARTIELDGLIARGAVRTKIQVRNADSFTVRDSYFRSTPRDSVEIFNVASVSIVHSEFHGTENGSIVLNRVNNLTVSDSLLDRDAVDSLDGNATADDDVVWRCTVAPGQDVEKVLSQERREEECANAAAPPGRKTGLEGGGGSGSAGAIVLASVSAFLLLAVVALLAFLHKAGRLEQYL